MRKIILSVIGGALLVPFVSQAQAEETNGRAYYDGGTRLEFEDFDVKMNIQLQPRYTYSDNDSEGRRMSGLDVENDVSSFTMRRARLVLSGNLLDKAFSYKLQNDFASSNGGGDLKDAWIQWNKADAFKIRFGQFKEPFGRQFRVSSSNLYFIDRSNVSEELAFDRANGAMALGSFGMGNYYAAVTNGGSDGEGRNRAGVDNNHKGIAAVDFTIGEYGSRGHEGDFERGGFGATFGAAAAYGQGQTAAEGDFDRVDVNADAGIRVAGFDVQGEFFWNQTDFDAIAGDVGEDDNVGFYFQGTYNICDNYGVGGRYGYISPDDETGGGVDDMQEVSLVLNYFINGHSLKLQNGVTWEFENFKDNGSEDLTDFRYELQLAGYF